MTDDVNLYSYVGNSPLNYTDTFGRSANEALPESNDGGFGSDDVIDILMDAAERAMDQRFRFGGMMMAGGGAVVRGTSGMCSASASAMAASCGLFASSVAGADVALPPLLPGATCAGSTVAAAGTCGAAAAGAGVAAMGGLMIVDGGMNGGGSKGGNKGGSGASPQDKILPKNPKILDEIAKKSGYDDFHALKDAFIGGGNPAEWDAFTTKNGEIYFKRKSMGSKAGEEFEPTFTNLFK